MIPRNQRSNPKGFRLLVKLKLLQPAGNNFVAFSHLFPKAQGMISLVVVMDAIRECHHASGLGAGKVEGENNAQKFLSANNWY